MPGTTTPVFQPQPANGLRERRCDLRNAGNSGGGLAEFFVEFAAPRLWFGPGRARQHVGVDDEDGIGLEAGVTHRQRVERAREEASRDDQRQRQRDLDDDEGVAHAEAAFVVHAAALFLERLVRAPRR